MNNVNKILFQSAVDRGTAQITGFVSAKFQAVLVKVPIPLRSLVASLPYNCVQLGCPSFTKEQGETSTVKEKGDKK